MINNFHGEHRWLSNFWLCAVALDGEVYSSVEAAYVAGKTTDEALRKQVRNLNTPGKVKRLGRTFKLRGDWDQVKVPLMLGLLRQKFCRGSRLGDMLTSTGETELVEGNNWGDTFWGVCRGKGDNNLGKLLMRVRQEIAN